MRNFHEDQAAGLRRIMAGPKPRIVSVLSASGKDDLPGILTNLAASLQRQGSDVLIVHAADESKHAMQHYGLEGTISLADTVRSKQAPEEAIVPAIQGFSAASLLPAYLSGRPVEAKLAQQLNKLLAKLANRHEIVLVQTALNEDEVLPLQMLNDSEIVIQLTAAPSSIKQAYRLIKQLYGQLGKRPFGILVHSASEAEAQTVFRNIAQVARQYLHIELDYVGNIPADEHLRRAYSLGRSVIEAFPMAQASQAFRDLANRFNYKQAVPLGLEPAAHL